MAGIVLGDFQNGKLKVEEYDIITMNPSHSHPRTIGV
jgi:hypothetical protein